MFESNEDGNKKKEEIEKLEVERQNLKSSLKIAEEKIMKKEEEAKLRELYRVKIEKEIERFKEITDSLSKTIENR